jgi:hypothetical protein
MHTLMDKLGPNDLALLLYMSPNQPGEFPDPAVLAANPDAPTLAAFPVLLDEDDTPGLPRTGTPSSSCVLSAVLLEAAEALRDAGTAVPAAGGRPGGREFDEDRMAWCRSMIDAVWPPPAGPVPAATVAS